MKNPPHNPDCFRGYFAELNKQTGQLYPRIGRRKNWDCPPCKAAKLADISRVVVAKLDRLCWGPSTPSKLNSPKKIFTVTFHDDVPIILAESHLYEPWLPSEAIMLQIIDYAAIRNVRQVNWSDKWRKIKPDTDPNRWSHVFPKDVRTHQQVENAIAKAGAEHGYLPSPSAEYQVMYNLEHILNGVTWKPSE